MRETETTHGTAYVQFNERLSRVQGMGAGLLTALQVAACWGQWRTMAIVGAIQVSVVFFNVFLINERLLRSWGVRRAETLRVLVNMGSGLVVNHLIHWPVVSWLFLPYVALVYDHFNVRIAYGVLAGECVAFSAVAMFDGVPWTQAFVFCAFAGFCSAITRARFDVMRHIAIDAEEQRKAAVDAHAQLVDAEKELRQAQKLEAVGRLAAGVAHEMNTPIQFVSDSLTFVEESVTGVLGVLRAHERDATRGEIEVLATDVDLPFVVDELPKAIALSREGLDRVAAIVRSMRQLAHRDKGQMEAADVNQAITMASVLANGECKSVADVKLELGTLPLLPCFIGEIGQVVLNLVVNAAHAIGSTSTRGKIVVRSDATPSEIVVTVSDTGPGIPPEAQEHVFEPFFTTKEVGKGTGQGLAIARSIIAKHGGTLTFESSPRGTTFRIVLPLAARAAA